MADSSRIDVDDARTLVATGDAFGKSEFLARNRDEKASVFLGGSDVTPASGFELEPGEALGFGLGAGEKLYGVIIFGGDPVRLDVLISKESE